MSNKTKKQRIHELEMENIKLRTEMISMQANKLGLSSMKNDPIYKRNLISEIKKVDYPLLLIPVLIERKLVCEKPGPGLLLIWNDELLNKMELHELFDLLCEVTKAHKNELSFPLNITDDMIGDLIKINTSKQLAGMMALTINEFGGRKAVFFGNENSK